MADKIDDFKVLSRGGLSTNNDTLELAESFPGKATRLVNYEVSQSGGYRRISGYEYWDSSATTIPGTGDTLGLFFYNNQLFGARAAELTSGAGYVIYAHTTAVGWSSAASNDLIVLTTALDSTAAGTAASLVYSTGTTSVRRLRHRKHYFNGTETLVVVDGVGYPYKYDGTDWITINGSTDLLGAKYLEEYKNRMAYAGFPGSLKNTVVLAAPNTDNDFRAASGPVSINTGFEVNGMKKFRDELYVFGTNSKIKKIVYNASNQTFSTEQVSDNLGCVAPDSIMELGGDVLYLSSDGVRTISGTVRNNDINLETISEDIKGTLINIVKNNNVADNLVSVTVNSKTQFRYFIYSTGETAEGSEGIIGGVRYGANATKAWEFGRLIGFKANCATQDIIDNSEVVVHGDDQGRVFKQETAATSFNGADIFSWYRTPYLDFTSTETQKNYIKLHVFFDPEGPFSLATSVTFDWDDPDSATPSNFTTTVDAVNSVYDDPNTLYDTTGVSWDGSGRTSSILPIHGSGAAVRFGFVNNDAETKSFSIQGFVVQLIDSNRRVTS